MTSYNNAQHDHSTDRLDPDRDEASLIDLHERETGRSNFAAFVLGGVVIAGSLLGFLYYDTDNLSRRDGLITGSIGALEQPSQPPVLTTPSETGRVGTSAPR